MEICNKLNIKKTGSVESIVAYDSAYENAYVTAYVNAYESANEKKFKVHGPPSPIAVNKIPLLTYHFYYFEIIFTSSYSANISLNINYISFMIYGL